MKKIVKGLLLAPILFTLVACTPDEPQENDNTEVGQNTQGSEGFSASERDPERTLIVYFSMPETGGTDAVAGSSRVVTEEEEVLGNVQQMAYWIEEETGSDTFQITTIDEYPGDHDELVAQGEAENESNFRPEIANHIENLEDYDTILFGYPIWVYDLPSVIYSFLDDTDFSGKTIIPFNAHGGSGFIDTREIIAELEPNADVEIDNGITISRNDVPDAQQEVLDWLSDIGF
ncbi:flavodoxin [Enterococcus olivae]